MSKQFWYCNVCNAQNHVSDGECQFCECGGVDCQRSSCSAPEHFHLDHIREGRVSNCTLCEGDSLVSLAAQANAAGMSATPRTKPDYCTCPGVRHISAGSASPSYPEGVCEANPGWRARFDAAMTADTRAALPDSLSYPGEVEATHLGRVKP